MKVKLLETYITGGWNFKKIWKNGKDSSPLWRHCTIQHDDRKVQFKMDALRPFRYPIVNQVNEGARVRDSKSDICM